MSTLKVTTVSDTAGTGPVTLTGQSAAKAWVDLPEGFASINDSVNISSIDDDGTGDFGLHYSSSFANAYYATVNGMEEENASPSTVVDCQTTEPATLKTSSSSDYETIIVNKDVNRSLRDIGVSIVLHGDLA